MKITFLGTSSMIPTKERNAFSILIRYENENILVDCGEGSQRQLRLINFSPAKITKILITHWHGDHVLGLPGLLQTLASSNYSGTLEIYGPKDSKKFLNRLMQLFINEGKLKVLVKEITKNGIFYKNNLFSISSYNMKHTANCLAYSIIENDKRKMNINYLRKFGLTNHPLLGKLQKGIQITYKGEKITPEKSTVIKKGKKVTIITDTKINSNCYETAKDSDLLICEATFMSNLKNKAFEFMHLTTEQAALIAKKSNSKRLVLTHISQRYKNSESPNIEKEAKKIFENTTIAKDLLTIIL